MCMASQKISPSILDRWNLSVTSRGFFDFFIRIFFSQPLLRYRQIVLYFVCVYDTCMQFFVYFDRLVFVSQEKKRKNERWVKRGNVEKKEGKNRNLGTHTCMHTHHTHMHVHTHFLNTPHTHTLYIQKHTHHSLYTQTHTHTQTYTPHIHTQTTNTTHTHTYQQTHIHTNAHTHILVRGFNRGYTRFECKKPITQNYQ